MQNLDKPELEWFKNKMGLYKESRYFFLVKVVNVEVTEKDMIFFHLKIIEKVHATFDTHDEFKFYDFIPEDWEEEFRFGGKDISYDEDSVYVMYIGELIFEESLIEQFRDKDTNLINNF